MLRIHFTDADLARTRVADSPDPLWELVMSLHRLQNRQGRSGLADWYTAARRDLAGSGISADVKNRLVPIAPRSQYFPDFLTPPEAAEGLEAGLEAIAALPRRELDHQLGRVAADRGRLPGWVRALGDGDARARNELLDLLRGYHRTVLEPHWDRITTAADADRAARARTVLSGGTDGLLSGFAPMMRWEPPVLHVTYIDGDDIDLHLQGRGLRLIPSYFCRQKPVALADHDLPPVLVYPVYNGTALPSAPAPDRAAEALGALLGTTRAAALAAVADGATTGELAARLSISPAAASHHTRVLRDAGLIISIRERNRVLHTLTSTGSDLLSAPAG
ncbi:ArsR/SmtB family transcription factor [Nocardiopsis potens]|uniref:ArsR/SmtB family transcription factor n=1 Tax=Nocardiopsis potens TaxID=1246458 RepID=UPI0003487EED|nr:helix-turn-helix domain-containing protein [Nocardiopsis potens]